MRRRGSGRPLIPAAPTRSEVTTARSDSALVAAARSGDRTAYEELYERHLDAVRAVCHRRLRHPEDVADAVQDTFLRAGSRLHALRDPARVGPWLKQIAASICIDLHRTRRTTPLDGSHLVMELPPDGARSVVEQPEVAAIAADEATRLHHHLAALGARDRRALWLRDALGLPVPDVARELGVTEGSARVLLTRARKRLRSSFAGVAAAAAIVRMRVEHVVRSVVDRPVAIGAPVALVATLAILHPSAPAPVTGPGVDPVARVPATTAAPGAHPSDSQRSGGDARGVAAEAGAPHDHVPTDAPPGPPDPSVRIGPEAPDGPEAVAVDANDDQGRVAGVVIWTGDVLEEVPPAGPPEDVVPEPVSGVLGP